MPNKEIYFVKEENVNELMEFHNLSDLKDYMIDRLNEGNVNLENLKVIKGCEIWFDFNINGVIEVLK